MKISVEFPHHKVYLHCLKCAKEFFLVAHGLLPDFQQKYFCPFCGKKL